MNKHIYICIWLLFIGSAAFSFPPGCSLKGIVRDNKGLPLQGAIVEFPDLKTGTVTDSNGRYVLGGLPKGRFIVTAGMLSYAKSAITINITGDNSQDFVLSETAIESKEVIITGQSKATEINRSPVPVVAVNSKFLQQNMSSNIIDAIAKVPGVSAVTTGPNVSKPFIRGLGFNRILTLYNGMRQEGQQWGDEHGIEVDEYSIDRTELVKGPSSLIYGSDALAGVINLLPERPAPDGKITGSINAGYQGNNREFAGSAMLSGNRNGFYWLGRVTHKQAGNYENAVDGRVYGTSFNETDANGSLGINKKWGFCHLDLSVFNDLQAIPDGSRDSATRMFTKQISEADTFRPVVSASELNSYAIPALHQLVQHFRAMSSNNFHVGTGLLSVNLGFEQSFRREFGHPQFPDIPALFLKLYTTTYDIKYYFHDLKGWDVTLGLNGMYQSNDVTGGTEFVIPSYHQFDAGPFAMVKKNYGKWDIAGGIRFDHRSFENNSLYTVSDPATGLDKATGSYTPGSSQVFSEASHTFSGVTYSAGATYIISRRVALKSNLARGFRAPNISELSANGVHPGTNVYQLGASGLKPELSLQEDIGVEYTAQHLTVNMSVFNNDIANYIYNRKLLSTSGSDSVIVPGNQTFRYTSSNARLYGGELSVDIHPHPLDWLHFENSISVVYGMNRSFNNDSERYLPFIPPVHGNSEVRGDFAWLGGSFSHSFIKLQLNAYATQNRVYLANNTETKTPGYLLINAGLGSDIVNKKGSVLFNFSVFGNNLLNTIYQDHLSRLKYFEQYPDMSRKYNGIYGMGRNIGIKLYIPIGVK